VTRRHKKKKQGCLPRLLLLLLGLLALRLWLDNRTVAVRSYKISDSAIPDAFSGTRIAVVSDVHGNEALFDKILHRLEAADPDIIALTGDLSDGEEQWAALEPFLRSMTHIAPCYYVSGNHEWADLSPEPFFRKVADCGVTLLRNDWVYLERGGSRLVLAGVEDPNGYADMETPAQLLTRLRSETSVYAVVLCHRPGLFPTLAAQGADLVLSGHNHGGLIRLPLLGGLLSPGGWLPEYDRGLFELGGCQLLVSPGLSAVSFCPRLFNRPEISIAVLEPAG